jgi:hypothetical protein
MQSSDDRMTERYEAAARAAGWVREGDHGGIIYNVRDYESWKAAVSWSPADGPVYGSWRECCEAEGIQLEAGCP